MTISGFSTGTAAVASLLRGVVAAAVLLSAVVHLELWAEGFNQLAVVGPAFLLNAVGGFAIGLLVIVWRHWLPLLLAVGFGLATLGAFVISVTVGLFGLHEVLYGVPQMTAGIAEIIAVVFGVAALLVERRATVDGDQAAGLSGPEGVGSPARPVPPRSRSAAH